ncbi:ciliogenesis and planar polarity effector 1-like isoform X2 [Liolophura sinensis]|uniref:ciliogenesis and planar polarity effector 1-like isoform X2 n=1 Tax=Liolophura sinensis TaxID=3198878 RepID=UPI003158F126
MKLNLEVLASTSIKRKKPWPKFAWLGEEKESLFLLDRNRLSVLYLPSGKTTRKIPKLSPLLPQIVCLSTTSNGHFLVCLLVSGDVAIWHKDLDMLKIIPGLLDHIPLADFRTVHAVVNLSCDCSKLIVVFNHRLYYVWEKDPRQNVLTTREEDLQGVWSTVVAPDNIPLPYPGQREASSHLVFYKNKVLGSCCQNSVVFTSEDKLCVSTVLVRFPDSSAYNRHPSVQAEWSNIQYPLRNINVSCEPMGSKGSYVVQYSPDGQVLAVGVNQRSASLTALLYISPLTETVIIADLRNCGTNPAVHCEGRDYWIADLAWTADGLFLTFMTRHGCLGVAPRLGEPLPLQSSGCSLDMGPTYYLPLHPLIAVRHHDGRESAGSEHDVMKQHFSVATNPRLPMILCSDGYLVTVLHFPPELGSVTLVRDLVLESSQHLSYLLQQDNLNMTVADAYKLPSGKRKVKVPGKYQFEMPPSNELMSSILSEDSLEGSQSFFPYLNSGQVEFGQAEALLATTDASFSNLDMSVVVLKHFEMAQRALFTAWGVVVSGSEDMSRNMENVTKYVLKNIVKLFSILLDSSCIEDIMEDLIPVSSTAPVQNLRLFKLLSLYKAVFHLCHFDAVKHDLMAAMLKFTHGTLDLILSSKHLQEHDPRLKTLLGCLAILKFTETILDKVYVWVPSSAQQGQRASYEHAYLTEGAYAGSHSSKVKSQQSVNLNRTKSLPSKRLCLSWKLLYKHCLHYQEKLKTQPAVSEHWAQVTDLTSRIQQKLQDLDVDLSPRHQHISTGDKLSLNGLYTQALGVWQNQLKNLAAGSESKRVSKLCHAQLYTYLLRGDLKQALDLVDNLLLQSNFTKERSQTAIGNFQGQTSSLLTLVTSTLKNQDSGNTEKIPCIRNKAIRKLVQSLARFMAAYFTNETLYVFPSHSPKPLPPVHGGKAVANSRILPVYHRDVSSMVSKCGLDKVWTTERTLEYLMLAGLVWEGVCFADSMGDWKSAFLLSVACKQHQKIAPHLYHSCKLSMQLPERLYPGSILERALGHLVGHPSALDTPRGNNHLFEAIAIDEGTDLSQLRQTLEEILKAGIMSMVDVAPWLLSGLVQRLKAVISRLQPLVPSEFYLPCPPIYCPQPTQTAEDALGSVDGEEEKRVRYAASSVTQLILVVLDASNLSLPLLRWYIKDLTIAQSRAAQFKATTEGPLDELPEILSQHYSMPSIVMSKLEYPAVQACMMAFRDFCALQWLIHSRDKLSMLLRKREKYLANLNYEDYLKSNWSGGQEEDWLRECFKSLQWAVNLLPFSHFLPDEGSLYKVVLSLLIELPPCEDTADILAEHLHDSESLDADVQEKLTVLLKQWQSVIIQPEDDGRSARDEEESLNESRDGKKSVTFLKASPRGKTLSVYFEKQCQVVAKMLKKKAKCFGRYDQFVFSVDTRRSTDRTKNDVDLFIGCRPFETKQSFMEFLDTFSAVCFSKQVDSEAESTNNSLPLLEPFAREVKKRELQSLAYKIFNSVRQRQSLSVFSTPKQNLENIQHENPAPESAAQLQEDKVRSPGKPNMTNLASKFSQSDDTVYKDVDAEGNVVSLDIDFGPKYAGLQSLLEWLTRWANKHHVLELGGPDSLQPKVRIHIPPQLVVLALWLVENKYSSPVEDNHTIAENHQESSHELQSTRSSQHEQSTNISTQQQSSVLKESIRSRTRKHMKAQLEVNTSVLSENVDDETLVQNAYAGILERNEESESAEISSAGSDDANPQFQNSLSIVRSGGSPMRSMDLLTDSFTYDDEVDGQLKKTPDTVIHRLGRSIHNRYRQESHHDRSFEGHRSSSAKHDQIRSHSHNIQHPHEPVSPGHVKHRSEVGSEDRGRYDQSERQPRGSRETSPQHSYSKHRSEAGSQGRRWRHGQSESPSRGTRKTSRSPTQGDSDLATQLQRVVRGELRRMMEVQHQSMMAMMGALDETVQPVSPKHAPLGSTNMSRGPVSSQLSQGTMGTEELRFSKKKGRSRKSQELREVLFELKDLQKESSYRKSDKIVYERSEAVQRYISEQGHSENPKADGADHGIPKFLRIPAERDTTGFKFPSISTSHPEALSQRMQQLSVSHVQIPLLRLPAPDPGMDVLRNFPKMSSQTQLPSPGYFRGLVRSHIPAPSPTVLPRLEDQGGPRTPGPIPPAIPLLRIDFSSHSHLNQFNSNAVGDQINPKEAVKQKLARDFYQQQMDNWQQHNQDKFGKQFLRVDFQRLDAPKPILDRDNEKRMRRRKEKDAEQAAHTATESEDIDQENLSSEPFTSPEHRKSQTKKKERGKSVVKKKENDRAVRGDEEEEEEELHDGYAIPPGIFESYLKYENEFGDRQPTNAKFQHDVAKALEQEWKKRQKKKVDFATMTKEQVDVEIETDLAAEGIRTAEASTSVTKDTGTDPIQEALIEYNRCIQGNVLAPDIYLGLRFGDERDPGSDSKVSEPARGFLNVVDIRASSVLRDLEGRGEQLRVQPDLTLHPTSLRASVELPPTSHQGTDVREEELRESLVSWNRVRGDSLTVGLFNRTHMPDDSVTAAVFSGAQSRERSRESVIRQLRNMDHQIKAIDNMSVSMQKDLNSTKLLLSTIESIGEAVHPGVGHASPRSSQRSAWGDKHSVLKDGSPHSTLTPVQSEKSPQRSVRSQGVSHSQSPEPSAAKTRDSGPSMDVKVSGLSGISDIIGEMLAEGGIDLSEAGLSPEEAKQLTRRATQNRQSQASGFDSVKMSVDKLQQIANEAGLNANKRDPEEQHALQEWMAERRRKTHAEYKKHRQELLDEERHPFASTQNTSRDPVTDHDILEAGRQREANRKTQTKENVEKRFLQATQLLGDILTDEVALPKEPATGSPKSARFARRMQTRVITPRGDRGARPKTAPTARATDRTAWEQASLNNGRVIDKTFRVSKQPSMSTHNQPSSLYYDERPIRPMVKPFLADPEELQQSGETTGQLARYTKMVESLETITENTPQPVKSGEEDNITEPDPESTVEPYKPKPFQELVRLQRPEITRKQVQRRPSSASSQRESPRTSRPYASSSKDGYSQNEKEKLYGSKHIPGASRRANTSPRRVKTYTERLQDMKKSKKVYSTPIVPQQTLPKHGTSNIPRPVSRGKGPLHKPMTYTQQLQQLSNKGGYSTRGMKRSVYVRPQVGIHSRGPRHKPQTYTQQLQKLNEQAPKTARTARASDAVLAAPTHSTLSQRQDTRARPYADPYISDLLEEEEIESDISSWEVDERVKQILYDDEDSSYAGRAISSREYQTSEAVSDYYDVIMSNEYANEVNVGEIRDIADAVSVSSGSIMSYIDWDAVDQLIGTS